MMKNAENATYELTTLQGSFNQNNKRGRTKFGSASLIVG